MEEAWGVRFLVTCVALSSSSSASESRSEPGAALEQEKVELSWKHQGTGQLGQG